MRRVHILWGILMIGAISWGLSASRTPPPTASPGRLRPPYDPALIGKTIAVYEARARRDREGAITLAQLAGYYLQRCRQSGVHSDALRAEDAARRSLAIRRRGNAAAYNRLAESLVEQHRFSAALAAVQEAAVRGSENAHTRCLRADLYMELGRYGAAEELLKRAAGTPEEASMSVVRARMLELRGQPELALVHIRQAQRNVDSDPHTPHADVAWYHTRIGAVLTGMGRASEAEHAFRKALEVFPDDSRAMAGLARLAAGRGDWQAAALWGEKAGEIAPSPAMAGLLADAYAGLGRKGPAEHQSRLVASMARPHGHGHSHGHGVIYDRQRAMFCADHHGDLDEALALARGELKLRRDIYAYDTLAWLCYRKGRYDEAESAMRRALALGTRDASLFFHAGMIRRARGDVAGARRYLELALQTNPYFSARQAAEARSVLAQLPL